MGNRNAVFLGRFPRFMWLMKPLSFGIEIPDVAELGEHEDMEKYEL